MHRVNEKAETDNDGMPARRWDVGKVDSNKVSVNTLARQDYTIFIYSVGRNLDSLLEVFCRSRQSKWWSPLGTN